MSLALITGITGQDGAYLAKLLLAKNYKVVGLTRSLSKCNVSSLEYLGIHENVILEECDLSNQSSVCAILKKYRPVEVYNLAAQSSVGYSFEEPVLTIHFNIISTLNLLEGVRYLRDSLACNTKFYQASSSEMFGKVKELPVTETTTIHPLSPYAVSKASAHWATVNYRESYGIYSCCGILFNHESYLRRDNFFIKKVLREAIEISKGKRDLLFVGNLNVRRDFGFGPKYVEAMWLMLQQEKAEEFIICSGESVGLKDIVEYIFKKLNISMEKCKVDSRLYRPVDLEDMYGDNSKSIKKLGWKYNIDFYQVLDILLDEELQNYSEETL